MSYDEAPVYDDPPSNQWFGMQAWSLERLAEYYYATGDAKAKAMLDKWVTWALANTTISATDFQIPSDLTWTRQAGHLEPVQPGRPTPACTSTVTEHGQRRRRGRRRTPSC